MSLHDLTLGLVLKRRVKKRSSGLCSISDATVFVGIFMVIIAELKKCRTHLLNNEL